MISTPDFEPLIVSIGLFTTLLISIKNKGILFFNRKIDKNISLIGYVNSGKSVYLSVLFDQIQKNKILDFESRLSGKETIERVNSDYLLLNTGSFLSRTPYQSSFVYRAVLYKNNFFNNLSYKVNIRELSGEVAQEIKNDERWLHQDDKLIYEIIASNSVWLSIDVTYYIDDKLKRLVQEYISILQIIRDNQERIGVFNIKSIAVLFLKSDMMERSEHYYLKEVEDFLFLANKLFNRSDCFFISSVGGVNSDSYTESPIKPISPKYVSRPLEWSLVE